MLSFPVQLPQVSSEELILLGYRILLLFVTLALGWVAGRVVGSVIGRLVLSAGGDSIFRRTALGRTLMKSGFTSGSFSRALTKWIIYITAFLIGFGALQLPFITSSINAFLMFLPTLISSVVILIVGIILSDLIGEFVKRSASPEQREVFYLNLLGDLIKVIFYFVTITVALANLGVDLTILYIVAQALAWGLAIFVGVAAGIIVGWLLKDKVKELLPP